MFRIPNTNQCIKNFLRLRKVESIKWINLTNVLFIGFVLTIRLRARVFYEQIVNEAQPSWLSLVENEGE